LHDYVAHDVSGMLVQAQAAALTPGLPTQVRDALTRIEHGGQRALASLDRTVHVLHTDPPTPDLRELVRAFDLDVDLELDDLPREVAATAHRVVTEALTNVRRHATRATRVAVHVTRRDGDVLVRVEDDGGGHSDTGRRSGHGLAGLAGLLARDGGTLTAGPHENGWLVEAVIRT
ncbi:MAG: two-component sensor histidine kinase, partial [Nonomuraea sp.]|nr:two-component sensor histidine kinase [Nonomuraea sp.]